MALTAKKVYAILKRQISDMEAKLNSPVRYRGTVATADLLPLNPDIGDMYNIESKSIYGEAGMNVAWNGVVWDTMGAPVDMSLYLTKEGADTTIQNMVNEYLEKNPVKPGATPEQAQQIEQNKTDIASLKEETGSLKEDLSNKITKFYASNQGEIHITDSDNGKIMDMMLYGKSEQFTATGKNLLKIKDGTQTTRGVTVTAKDGVFALKGTATETGWAILDIDSFVLDGMCILSSNISTGVRITVANKSFTSVLEQGESATLENAEVSKVYFIVTEGKTYDISNILVQIEKGSVATSYEPYTGGQPSPSPDYPQEIKSVVNPTVKVCGKNLWNPIAGGYISGKDGSITEAPKKQMAVTDFIKTNGKDITVIARNFSSAIVDGFAYRIGFYNARKKWIKNVIPSDGNKYSINTFGVTDSEYIRVSAPSGIYDTIQIEYGSEATPYEPYTEQSVPLPYTLNAIPVTSGGNVTIDGQQYIADYVDVERGKLVRMVDTVHPKSADDMSIYTGIKENVTNYRTHVESADKKGILSNMLLLNRDIWVEDVCGTDIIEYDFVDFSLSYEKLGINSSTNAEQREIAVKTWLENNDLMFMYTRRTSNEIDLTPEEVQTFKALATYYPVTNISVNSEQLDGYTVFNYPISLANGWNYVKQQLNDNRDYIYDMDLQSAESYVNSEYAVALTELEV